MKISNNSKYFIKIAFLFFIIMSSFYIYYLLNNEFKISEGFAGNYDCSECKVQPSLGNCIPIYDINYTINSGSTANSLLGNNLTISNELTELIFCEWQPSQTCISNNLPGLNERLNFSNNQITNIQSQLYDITCCDETTSTFYSNYTISYEALLKNKANSNICTTLDTCLNNIFSSNSRGVTFNDQRYIELQQLQTNRDYRLTKSLCNDLSTNSYKPGLVFRKTDNSKNIFDVPNILPKDLIDFIMNSNFSSRLSLTDPVSGTRLNDISYTENLEARNKINSHLQLFEYLNDQLISRQINLTRRAIYDDLTTLEKTRYGQAKNDLRRIFSKNNIPSSNYLDISYNLLSKTFQATTPYVLNPNQFFNCFGTVQQDNSGVFSTSDLLDLSNNDYFGTGRDSSYSAFGSDQPTLYPSNNDLQMELARLQTIPSSGNAPVSVINTYLNAINSFYEKQIQNLTGPRDHVFNQELIFDNNTLETVTPTFFTYDDKANNTYTCTESVTGNSIFKDCGPAAYVGFSSF